MWGQTKRRGNWEVTHLTLAEEAKNWDWSVRCHTSDYLCVDCCWYFDFCVDHLFPNIAIQRNIIVAMCEVRLQNWGWIVEENLFVGALEFEQDKWRQIHQGSRIWCVLMIKSAARRFQQVTNASPLCSSAQQCWAPTCTRYSLMWIPYKGQNNTRSRCSIPDNIILIKYAVPIPDQTDPIRENTLDSLVLPTKKKLTKQTISHHPHLPCA